MAPLLHRAAITRHVRQDPYHVFGLKMVLGNQNADNSSNNCFYGTLLRTVWMCQYQKHPQWPCITHMVV